MATHKSRALAAVALMVVLVGGCAVGPNFKKPAAPQVSDYTRTPLSTTSSTANIPGGEAQHFANGLDVSADWWTLFHSTALNELIEQDKKNDKEVKRKEEKDEEEGDQDYIGEEDDEDVSSTFVDSSASDFFSFLMFSMCSQKPSKHNTRVSWLLKREGKGILTYLKLTIINMNLVMLDTYKMKSEQQRCTRTQMKIRKWMRH